MKKLYALSGGRNVGKTTVAEILRERGYVVMPNATEMVRKEFPENSNPLEFRIAVINRQAELESEAPDGAFVDEGMIENLVYAYNDDLVVPDEQRKLIDRTMYEFVFSLHRRPLHFVPEEERLKELSEQTLTTRIMAHYCAKRIPVRSIPCWAPDLRADRVEMFLKEELW